MLKLLPGYSLMYAVHSFVQCWNRTYWRSLNRNDDNKTKIIKLVTCWKTASSLDKLSPDSCFMPLPHLQQQCHWVSCCSSQGKEAERHLLALGIKKHTISFAVHASHPLVTWDFFITLLPMRRSISSFLWDKPQQRWRIKQACSCQSSAVPKTNRGNPDRQKRSHKMGKHLLQPWTNQELEQTALRRMHGPA